MLENQTVSQSEIAQLAEILNRKYAAYTGQRFFAIECQQTEQQAWVQVALQNPSETYFYPVQGRVLLENNEIGAKEAVFLLLDYIDVYFKEYLESDESTFIPIDWTPYEFEGTTLHLKGQILNKKAERMAAELLGDGQL